MYLPSLLQKSTSYSLGTIKNGSGLKFVAKWYQLRFTETSRSDLWISYYSNFAFHSSLLNCRRLRDETSTNGYQSWNSIKPFWIIGAISWITDQYAHLRMVIIYIYIYVISHVRIQNRRRKASRAPLGHPFGFPEWCMLGTHSRPQLRPLRRCSNLYVCAV